MPQPSIQNIHLLFLQKSSFVKNEIGYLEVVCKDAEKYLKLRVEVFSCGVENPKGVCSKETGVKVVGGHPCQVAIDTAGFAPGFYEIKRLGFHTPKNDSTTLQSGFFVSGRDFPRTFFEVITSEQRPKTKEEIEKAVQAIEEKLESEFFSGIDFSNGAPHSHDYEVFVFMSGVNITRPMRLGKCEVIPFRGLDTKDRFDLINEFFMTNSRTDFEFNYTLELSKQKRLDNPVCIVHFPRISAEQEHDAKIFCYQESLILAEVLSAYRGGAGKVFAVVVMDPKAKRAQMYTESRPNIDNLLSGSTAAEDPDTIKKQFQKLKTNLPLRHVIGKTYFLTNTIIDGGNLIDIHAHVLPAIDDGPNSWEETMDMIHQAREDGIAEVTITHHILSNIAYQRESEIIEKFNELKERIASEKLNIKLHLGSEIYAQPDMELFHTIATYNNNKKYFLVEFPMQGIPRFVSDRFFKLVLDGMIPIIAHPERNLGIIRHPERAFEFVQQGALLQMNAGSILGRHGPQVRDTAMILLNSNLIHFCASDGHNTTSRPLKLRSAYSAVAEGWGKDCARLLFKDNPRKALHGEEIKAPEPTPIQPLKKKGLLASVEMIKKFFD